MRGYVANGFVLALAKDMAVTEASVFSGSSCRARSIPSSLMVVSSKWSDPHVQAEVADHKREPVRVRHGPGGGRGDGGETGPFDGVDVADGDVGIDEDGLAFGDGLLGDGAGETGRRRHLGTRQQGGGFAAPVVADDVVDGDGSDAAGGPHAAITTLERIQSVASRRIAPLPAPTPWMFPTESSPDTSIRTACAGNANAALVSNTAAAVVLDPAVSVSLCRAARSDAGPVFRVPGHRRFELEVKPRRPAIARADFFQGHSSEGCQAGIVK